MVVRGPNIVFEASRIVVGFNPVHQRVGVSRLDSTLHLEVDDLRIRQDITASSNARSGKGSVIQHRIGDVVQNQVRRVGVTGIGYGEVVGDDVTFLGYLITSLVYGDGGLEEIDRS